MREPGRPVESWQTALDTFLSGKKRINKKTKDKYRMNYTRFFKALEDAGMKSNPSDIGEAEISYLLDVVWKDLEESTREWYIKLMNMFLLRFRNAVVSDMGIVFNADMRTNVDWLKPMDVVNLIDAELTPLQELVIHFELMLGLRRIEVIRLTLDDIHNGYIDVRGKGRGKGKWRTVPFHKDTPRVIRRWMSERNRLIEEARQYRPNIPVPDNLIIWKRYKKKPRIGSYSENGDALDDQVKLKIRDQHGIVFDNHTLRRTCGRMLFESRTPIEVIARLFGHEELKTTKDYIGVDLDHMNDAMTALDGYIDDIRSRTEEVD